MPYATVSFSGMFFKVSTRKSQKGCTLSIRRASSGECGCTKVGPKLTISQFGYFEPRMPHSKPAWMTMTLGSLPNFSTNIQQPSLSPIPAL